MLFLVIFWLRTRAASTYHLMHSLAKETVSAWVCVQLEGVRAQTHFIVFDLEPAHLGRGDAAQPAAEPWLLLCLPNPSS